MSPPSASLPDPAGGAPAPVADRGNGAVLELHDVVLDRHDRRGGGYRVAIRAGGAVAVGCAAGAADRLVEVCLGMAEPVSGRVRVLGVDPAALGRGGLRRLRGRLGACFGRAALVSNLTLAHNVLVPLLYRRGVRRRRATERVGELLQRLEIEPWSHHRPGDVPLRVRALGEAARALAPRPELLLLADPFADLAPDEERLALDLCRSESRTVVLFTPRRRALPDGWERVDGRTVSSALPGGPS